MLELSRELGVELRVALDEVVHPEELCGSDASELVRDPRGRDLRDPEASRGEVDPSDPCRDLCAKQRGEEVVLSGVEDGLLSDRPRRDHADDAPVDDALGLFRVSELLTDGDLVALLNEADEVALCCFHRDSRHGDRVVALGA